MALAGREREAGGAVGGVLAGDVPAAPRGLRVGLVEHVTERRAQLEERHGPVGDEVVHHDGDGRDAERVDGDVAAVHGDAPDGPRGLVGGEVAPLGALGGEDPDVLAPVGLHPHLPGEDLHHRELPADGLGAVLRRGAEGARGDDDEAVAEEALRDGRGGGVGVAVEADAVP